MNILTLGDISNGSDLILWITFMLFAIISIVLLSGHGSGLIAGYNTAGKEEQGKYDVKKLCRIIGIGMGIVAILFFFNGNPRECLTCLFCIYCSSDNYT